MLRPNAPKHRWCGSADISCLVTANPTTISTPSALNWGLQNAVPHPKFPPWNLLRIIQIGLPPSAALLCYPIVPDVIPRMPLMATRNPNHPQLTTVIITCRQRLSIWRGRLATTLLPSVLHSSTMIECRKPSSLRVIARNVAEISHKKPKFVNIFQNCSSKLVLLSEIFPKPSYNFRISNYISYIVYTDWLV